MSEGRQGRREIARAETKRKEKEIKRTEREREREPHGRHPRSTFLNWHNLQPRPNKLSAFMQKGRHKARLT